MKHNEAKAIYNAGQKVVVETLRNLSQTIVSQREEIKQLKIKIAKLSKNSTNSSKPPSSDITNKKKGIRIKKGKIGGQPGHKGNFRDPFSDEEIDKFHSYVLTGCPVCDTEVSLRLDISPRIQQQVEIIEVPIIRKEHRSYAVWFEKCQQDSLHAFSPACC